MRRTLGLLILAAVATAGCQRDAAPGAAPKAGSAPPSAPAPKKAGPTVAEATQGMVEATTVGKSSLAVQLKFALERRPVVGTPLKVALAWLPDVLADQVDVQATGSVGLQVGASPIPALGSVEPSEAYPQTLEVTPTQEGVQLLTLNFTVKRDDGVEARAFAIPLLVAPASAAP